MNVMKEIEAEIIALSDTKIISDKKAEKLLKLALKNEADLIEYYENGCRISDIVDMLTLL